VNRLLGPNARLLGLPIWRKKLSDTEFVDKIRRSLRLSRWFRHYQGLLGIGVVAMSFLAIRALMNLLKGQGVPVGQQNQALFVFALAAMAGLGIGFWFSSVLHTTVMLFVEQRKDRLLVACWDALQQLIGEKYLQEKDQTSQGQEDEVA
jgi:hypothetical protein